MTTYDPKINYAGWTATEKMDGINAKFDGVNLISKSGRVLPAPRSFLALCQPGEGELWAGRGRFETCQSDVSSGTFDQVVFVRYSEMLRTTVQSNEHAVHLMQSVVDQGGEGIILTSPDGERVKLKPQIDDEAQVLGYELGRTGTKWEGKLSCVIAKWQGLTIRLASGITAAMQDNPPMAGQLLTFGYAGTTASGQPRHARILRRRESLTM